MIYKIARIMDRAGNDRIDGRYPLRIGRKCEVGNLTIGKRLSINYLPPYEGVLNTSPILDYSTIDSNYDLVVFTMNSIYCFDSEDTDES